MCMEYKKEVVLVNYYNVLFYLIFKSEIDELKKSLLIGKIESGEQMRMKDIYNWGQTQQIQVKMKFKYRQDFSVIANLWNLYSYWRFRYEIRK